MPRLSITTATALYAGLLVVCPIAAPDSPTAAQESPLALPTDGTASPTEPVSQWLDEVRAQRQIREERRRAAKEAMDARRRWIDPWGAAQQDARKQETQRRRDAFFEHIERDRNAFRNQTPWGFQQGPWINESPSPSSDSPQTPAQDPFAGSGPENPQVSTYPLPGWDNRWYYRGF